MSRRTPRSNLTVSLFPFLAVLVCAMGALIFLLIVTTQMIGDETAQKQAAEVAIPEPPPPPQPQVDRFIDVDPYELPNRETLDAAPEFVVAIPKPEPPPEPKVAVPPPPDPNIELRRQLAALKAEQKRRQQQLAEQTADLQAAEKELAAAQLDLQQQQAALDELRADQQQLRGEDDEHLAQRKRLLLKIRKAEEHLDELQKRLATTPSKFALIPYDGRQGTTRRPIFVECTDKGIRFLPENVFLGPPQLEGFTDSYNPLLSGVRALNDYWNQQARASGAENAEKPYLLLIVRPEGSITYYLARKLLTEWKESYGYELIEEDFAWQLPAADPQAQRVLRKAIAETLKSRRDVIRKYTVRGSLDELSEFPDRDELTDEDLPFTHGTSNASRFAEKARQYRRRIAERGNAAGGNGRGTGNGRRSKPSLPGWDEVPPQSGRGESMNPRGNESAETGLSFGDPSDAIGRAGDVPHRFLSPADAAALEFGQNPATDGKRQAANGAAALGDDPFLTDGGNGPSPLFNDLKNSPDKTDNPLEKAPRGDARSGSNASKTGTGTEPGRTADAGTPAKSAGPESNSPDGKSSRGRSGENANPTPYELAKSPFNGRTTTTPAQSSQNQQQQPSQSGGTSSPSAIGRHQPQVLPPLTFERRQKMEKMKRNLAKRGWGLSRRTGIGIERSVHVVITPDRIHVGNLDMAILLGQGETEQQVLRAVIVDIDENAKEWGNPPSGFYWVPMVRFHVHPTAVNVSKPIERALREGGLSTKTVYLEAGAGAKQEVSR